MNRIGKCQYCGEDISQDRDGYWGTEDVNDSHPWYCDVSPEPEKYHVPAGIDDPSNCIVKGPHEASECRME